SDDISSTNVETDVTGMLRIGLSGVAQSGGVDTPWGGGPAVLRALLMRNGGVRGAERMHARADNAPNEVVAVMRTGVVGGGGWEGTALVIIPELAVRRSGARLTPGTSAFCLVVCRLEWRREPGVEEERHERGAGDDAGDRDAQMPRVDRQQEREHQHHEQRDE